MIEQQNEIIALLRRHRSFNLVAHIQPDGDSIGSLLAMGEALEKMGNTVRLFTADKVPEKYTFLQGSEKILATAEQWLEDGAAVVLDCSDLERSGVFREAILCSKVIINIDHHRTNRYFGTANLVDPEAAATGEIIFYLLKAMRLALTRSLAEALYIALSTDTGSFKFENTTAATHRAAAELLEQFKLNPGTLSEQVFDLRPLPFYLLLKKVLGTLELHGDKQIAALTASREMLEQSGAMREDLDGMINFARNIKGVEIGIMFFIDSPEEVKVGFRSRTVDASALAESLGGGGHARAAGCRLREPYVRAREKVLREALRALGALEPTAALSPRDER